MSRQKEPLVGFFPIRHNVMISGSPRSEYLKQRILVCAEVFTI
jgi:hypothetical protein